MAHFERDGIAFQYPETWTLTPEDYEAGWGVSVFSPGTAFLSLTFDAGAAPPDMLADAALGALTDEYPQIEAEPVNDTIAGLPAIGHDFQFLALDLTNTGWIRATIVSTGTLLMFWQANDLEEQHIKLLRAICSSITIDDE